MKTATETRKEFRQEHGQLQSPDTAFLGGLLQMLAAMYCRSQHSDDPTNDPKKEESQCKTQSAT